MWGCKTNSGFYPWCSLAPSGLSRLFAHAVDQWREEGQVRGHEPLEHLASDFGDGSVLDPPRQEINVSKDMKESAGISFFTCGMHQRCQTSL